MPAVPPRARPSWRVSTPPTRRLKITDDAVQVLGGHGYIRDHMVELWLRNARGFSTFDGIAIV